MQFPSCVLQENITSLGAAAITKNLITVRTQIRKCYREEDPIFFLFNSPHQLYKIGLRLNLQTLVLHSIYYRSTLPSLLTFHGMWKSGISARKLNRHITVLQTV